MGKRDTEQVRDPIAGFPGNLPSRHVSVHRSHCSEDIDARSVARSAALGPVCFYSD